MKKNRTMKIATLMLALTLITCCFVGSTFAKYTSSATQTDSAQVAKWSFKVGETDIATSNSFVFDLFKDGVTYDEAGNNVAADKVAPGTLGEFDIVLKNASQVDAEYTIKFTVTLPTVTIEETTHKLPIKFSVDGGATWDADLAELADATKKAIAMNAEETITVQWKWDFGEGNAVDTAFGVAAPEVAVRVDITAEQVD